MKRVAMLIMLIGFAIALPAILLIEKWEGAVIEDWENETKSELI